MGLRTVDLSGMGGGYENACQEMLAAGEKWLSENGEKKAKVTAKTYEGVYGILEPASPEAEELSHAITDAVSDCTGAMHQCVMSHLMYIGQHGKDKWFELFKDQPGRFFEWDGTEKTCPGAGH